MPRGVYPRKSANARFWAKVDKDGPIPEYAPHLGPCWLWVGGLVRGYGQISFGATGHVRAHRWAFEQARGSIPRGLEIDHLCRTLLCVRSSHLEAVTHRQNMLRGKSPVAEMARRTHCNHGHPFDELNTAIRKGGARRCRTCYRASDRDRSRRQRELKEA